MNINLKQIETFVWVADLRSFRRAAARLNTTQPNISSRISALESLLGTTLMERDAGSVRLTTRGEQLLGHARLVLRSMERFIEAADESTLFDGVLRLGITEMIVHTWLPEFLKTFKERYPNTSIELKVDLSVNIEQELADHSLDLAFQSSPFNIRMSGDHSLGSYPLVWVAAPSAKLHLMDSVSFEELIKFPIITHARNTRLYEDMLEHTNTIGDGSTKARLVPSSNLAACVQMAVDGFGVAALLEPLAESDLENGRLRRINYEWQPDDLSFSARYDRDKASNIVLRAAELASDISNRYTERYS